MIRLPGLTMAELKIALAAYGLPDYRLRQIFQAIYKQGTTKLSEITVLPGDLRRELINKFTCESLLVLAQQKSQADNAEKRLLQLEDLETIETVHLQQSYGSSICVSTQVGCRMGCRMCASGQDGWKRNLTSQEMFLQLWSFMSDYGIGCVDNILLMGSGEPFDNFTNCLAFYELVIAKEALNLSNRNFVLSTCGLVPKIRELAQLKTKITLAVSLHSAINDVRDSIVPLNRKYPVEMLLDACEYYFAETSRRVTVEYALIQGLNDGVKDIEALIAALRNRKGLHVNIIPANPYALKDVAPPDAKTVQSFFAQCERAGIAVSVRYSKGGDILAACGQLKGK